MSGIGFAGAALPDAVAASVASATLPSISVIVVTYNAEKHLEETIRSILGQQDGTFELIMIDGGSTDRTMEIIKKHESSGLTWISEPDGGIYEAMNKGLDRARGEWIYFLGADDVLAGSGVFEKVCQQAAKESDDTKMIFGEVTNYAGRKINSQYSAKLLLHNTLHHQSCFYRNGIFEHFRYDASLKIVADYELNLRLYLDRVKASKMSCLVARCRDGGASTARRNYQIFITETDIVRKRCVGPVCDMLLRPLFHAKAGLQHAF